MSLRLQAAVIGGGPAGLAAGAELTARGVKVAVLDEGPYPGGPTRHSPTSGFAARPNGPVRGELVGPLVEQARRTGTEILSQVQVVGLEEDGTIWAQQGQDRLLELKAEYVLFATGARERFIPFAGWTLPGVISTGAAQIILERHGILPGQRIVVAGSGPLPLLLASHLAGAGGRVAALLDHSSWRKRAGAIRHLAGGRTKLLQGLGLLAGLLRAGIRPRTSTTVAAARGADRLEEVETVRIDGRGRPLPGSERTIPADCLALGHGFSPNIELPQLAGCEIVHDPFRGGWLVRVDRTLMTSREGFYAAGEITGLGGGPKSVIEGRLAALHLAARLGAARGRDLDRQVARLAGASRREESFGRFLTSLAAPPPGLWDLIGGETVICRCEDVTLNRIQEAVGKGAVTLDSLKKATRCGMGRCQGRICGPILAGVLGRLVGPEAGAAQLSLRPPLKPIPLSLLVGEEPGDPTQKQRTFC